MIGLVVMRMETSFTTTAVVNESLSVEENPSDEELPENAYL